MKPSTALGLIPLLAMLATAASASTFTVNPTRITLPAEVRSALVTVRNEGDAKVRIRVKFHHWTQGPLGEMQLGDTSELIVFPTLFELEPGEERKVRVARTAGAGSTERTYRIFVEELPPMAGDPEAAPGVRMLTRMGIPVFVQPARLTARAGLLDLEVTGGHLRFRLENLGNVHFVPDEIRITGRDASGAQVLGQIVHGWYILAGGARAFDVTLDASGCDGVRHLVVEVQVGNTILKEQLQTPRGVCGA